MSSEEQPKEPEVPETKEEPKQEDPPQEPVKEQPQEAPPSQPQSEKEEEPKQEKPPAKKSGRESKEASPDREDKQDGDGSKQTKEDGDKKKTTKSANTTKDKLKYLEEKYKEVYKESNLRKDELNKLVQVARDILTDAGIKKVEEGEYKSGEAEWIMQHWSSHWEKLLKKFEQEKKTIEEEGRIKTKSLQDALHALSSDHEKAKQVAAKEAKDGLDKTVKNLEDLNNKIHKENASLLLALKNKDGEISELKSQVLALSNKATDSLMVRFDQLEENDISSKLLQSSRVDELIKLRNELDEAYTKIDSLEAQLAAVKTQVAQQPEQPQPTQQTPPAQTTQQEPDPSQPKFKFIKSKPAPSTVSTSTQTQEKQLHVPNSPQHYEPLENRLERERLSNAKSQADDEKGYLKSLIVKFLVYEAKKNETECAVLRRAILDVLQVSSTERATIDDAVNNRGGIKDSMYFLRLFGGQH
jgi:outer membrane biosynthesis protein TonB